MNSCVSSAYRWCLMGGEEGVLREEIKELSGVVYIMNRIGPRTEPWGTPVFKSDGEDFTPLH